VEEHEDRATELSASSVLVSQVVTERQSYSRCMSAERYVTVFLFAGHLLA
jgi:hypothetical protein